MSKFAFVFPGQGSQSVGMLSEMLEQHAVVAETYQQASEALNYNMKDLILNDPEQKLNITEYTQPALLAADVACWRVWQSMTDSVPAYFAGHSLGEYSALVCAGVLDFGDAVKLVAARGRYMQAAVPEGVGAMAAIIGLDEEKVDQACVAAKDAGLVSAANYNSVGQIVIAGETAAVDKAIVEAKALGAKIAKKIPVSVPSHCELMRPAAEKLTQDLLHIALTAPTIPVVNNVDVGIEFEGDKISDALIRQLYKPVQWVKTIERLTRDGVDTIAECGPGKVLTGLNKRIDKTLNLKVINTPELMREFLQNIGGV